jgi:putative SOS response-associated peptidase YedK
MCGRFTIAVPAAEIAELLGLPQLPPIVPRYNAAPTQQILAARLTPEGKREALFLRWGLVPHWADDVRIAYKLINARCETVAAKSSFRDAFRKRRCLIPADGFFEWKAEGKKKKPFRFRRRDGKPFLFAGLWERRERPGEELLQTCTIVTTAANRVVHPFHERMPVILTTDAGAKWLKPGPLSDVDAAELFAPAADDFLITEPVCDLVNSPRVDDPKCIEVVKELFDNPA